MADTPLQPAQRQPLPDQDLAIITPGLSAGDLSVDMSTQQGSSDSGENDRQKMIQEQQQPERY